MAKVVSMINWKGGVGKSTLTLHLGVGMMLESVEKPKVLLVDLDPQCNLSYLALGVNDYVEKVYKNGQSTLEDIFDAYFEGNDFDTCDAIIKQPIISTPGYVWSNVDVLPSHQSLVLVDLRLAREKKSGTSHQEETRFELDKLSIIQKAIEQVADEYDFILLDCPPNINLVTQNAFFASQHYVIPAIPDFLSTVGISLIKDEMENMNSNFKNMITYCDYRSEYTDAIMTGIIFNMVDEYGGGPKGTHRQTISTVRKQHAGMVFENYVTDGDGISVASENNMTVYSHAELPKSQQNALKQAEYLTRVSNELLRSL